MNKEPISNLYTVDVDAYATWLTGNGYTLELLPRRGQVVEWMASFRVGEPRPLEPYDWMCRVCDPENYDYQIELPFAFLVRVVAE